MGGFQRGSPVSTDATRHSTSLVPMRPVLQDASPLSPAPRPPGRTPHPTVSPCRLSRRAPPRLRPPHTSRGWRVWPSPPSSVSPPRAGRPPSRRPPHPHSKTPRARMHAPPLFHGAPKGALPLDIQNAQLPPTAMGSPRWIPTALALPVGAASLLPAPDRHSSLPSPCRRPTPLPSPKPRRARTSRPRHTPPRFLPRSPEPLRWSVDARLTGRLTPAQRRRPFPHPSGRGPRTLHASSKPDGPPPSPPRAQMSRDPLRFHPSSI